MTDKQDALDFIETIYERELRDFGSHSIHDPTHEQRLKHILSFQKHIETIRQALTAPCIGKDDLCPCQDGDMCHYKGENPFLIPAPVVDVEGLKRENISVDGLSIPSIYKDRIIAFGEASGVIGWNAAIDAVRAMIGKAPKLGEKQNDK